MPKFLVGDIVTVNSDMIGALWEKNVEYEIQQTIDSADGSQIVRIYGSFIHGEFLRHVVSDGPMMPGDIVMRRAPGFGPYKAGLCYMVAVANYAKNTLRCEGFVEVGSYNSFHHAPKGRKPVTTVEGLKSAIQWKEYAPPVAPVPKIGKSFVTTARKIRMPEEDCIVVRKNISSGEDAFTEEDQQVAEAWAWHEYEASKVPLPEFA